jgi:hypothetical protein
VKTMGTDDKRVAMSDDPKERLAVRLYEDMGYPWTWDDAPDWCKREVRDFADHALKHGIRGAYGLFISMTFG